MIGQNTPNMTQCFAKITPFFHFWENLINTCITCQKEVLSIINVVTADELMVTTWIITMDFKIVLNHLFLFNFFICHKSSFKAPASPLQISPLSNKPSLSLQNNTFYKPMQTIYISIKFMNLILFNVILFEIKITFCK